MEDGDEVHLDVENGEAQKSKAKKNVMLKDDAERWRIQPESKRGISHRRCWKERGRAFRFHGLPNAGRCSSEVIQHVVSLDLRISRAHISYVKVRGVLIT